MIGDKITIDGYSFYETLHGPLVLTPCVDCGKQIGTRGRLDDTEPWPPVDWGARCTGCCRTFHGLD